MSLELVAVTPVYLAVDVFSLETSYIGTMIIEHQTHIGIGICEMFLLNLRLFATRIFTSSLVAFFFTKIG